MTNTTRTELRSCSSFTSRGMCGAEFTATIEGLDSGFRTCERCRKLPSVRFTLSGNDRGETVCLLDGSIADTGERAENHAGIGLTTWANVRRWADRARADGVRSIRLEVRRHTNEHGSEWARRRIAL